MASLVLLWKHRQWALLALLALLFLALKAERARVRELETALEAKPKVEERVRVETRQGPVRIVTRTIEKPVLKLVERPGKCSIPRWGKERVIERVEERGPVDAILVQEHQETPVCPAPRRVPHYIVGAMLNPEDWKQGAVIRAGYSFGSWDLTYGYALRGPGRHRVDVAHRF